MTGDVAGFIGVGVILVAVSVPALVAYLMQKRRSKRQRDIWSGDSNGGNIIGPGGGPGDGGGSGCSGGGCGGGGCGGGN